MSHGDPAICLLHDHAGNDDWSSAGRAIDSMKVPKEFNEKEKIVNTARDVYDSLDRQALNGITRGALQTNLRFLASMLDRPVAAEAVMRAVYRLDAYEAAAFRDQDASS